MATRSAVAHAVFDLSHYVRTSRGRLAADTGCGGMAADGISYRPDFSRASDALSSREFARVLVLARDEIVGLDGAEVRLVSPPSPIVPAGVYTFGSGPQACAMVCADGTRPEPPGHWKRQELHEGHWAMAAFSWFEHFWPMGRLDEATRTGHVSIHAAEAEGERKLAGPSGVPSLAARPQRTGRSARSTGPLWLDEGLLRTPVGGLDDRSDTCHTLSGRGGWALTDGGSGSAWSGTRTQSW